MSDEKDKKTEKALRIARVIVTQMKEVQEAVNQPMSRQIEADVKMDLIMTIDIKCEDREIEDMLGWIDWCQQNDRSIALMTSTLLHDISGIANHEPCFLPKTSGYAKYRKASMPLY